MRRRYSSSVKVFYPKFSREELIEMIRGRLNELSKKLPLSMVVLFGSYAKSAHTVSSDVDLLVVYKGDRREDAYAIVRKTLDVPGLEPHIFTEDEFKNVDRRMMEDGIVLWDENI